MSRDIQSIVFYEAYGVTIPGYPLGCIFETSDFISDINCEHSACGGSKSLSLMLGRHLQTSKLHPIEAKDCRRYYGIYRDEDLNRTLNRPFREVAGNLQYFARLSH